MAAVSTLLGPTVRSDVDDELAFHVELRVDELVACGMDPATARAEAWRRIGDIEALKRTCRAISGERLTTQRRHEWMRGTWTELRVAARQLLRYPVLASVAVLTLALGLGATTGIFSVLYAVMLRPLPYADANRIVRISETMRGEETQVGPGQFTEWLARARAFESMGAYLPTTFNLTDGTPERVPSHIVTPGFFETVRTPLEAGRLFTSTDRANAPPVAIINEALARRLWPNESAVGKRIARCTDAPVPPWLEVVGVVGDMRQFLRRDPVPELYVPIDQTPPASWIWHGNSLAFVVRTDGTAADVLREMRATINAVDPTLPVYDALTYDELLRIAAASNRFSTLLLSVLAALALVLAAVGLCRVLAFSVAQRTFEMGVRVALGARPRDVLALVTRQGMLLVLLGLVLGLGLAITTSRTIGSLLYQVPPTDPLSYVVAGVLLVLVGMVACYVPARRAAAVDPATSLRA